MNIHYKMKYPSDPLHNPPPKTYLDEPVGEIVKDMIINEQQMSEDNRANEIYSDHVEEHQAELRHDDHDRPSTAHSLISGSISDPWMKRKKASQFFVSMFTCLYALILSIFSFVIELSPTWQTTLWRAETIFTLCMYGLGIFFFIFLYVFLIYPQPLNFCIKLLGKYRVIPHPEKYYFEPCSHTGEGAGTLYLRLGALLFGCAALMLLGIEIALCVQTDTCTGANIAKHCLALIFIFCQMHFLCCNTKITVVRFQSLCKLGFMHLIAVNIWDWFRFVLAKQIPKAVKKLTKKYGDNGVASSSSSSSSEEQSGDAFSVGHGYLSDVVNDTVEAVLQEAVRVVNDNITTTTESPSQTFTTYRMLTITRFGDLSTFLITCIVEYSIIGGAVMFIIWRSINNVGHDHGHGHGGHGGHGTRKRKHKFGMDCSNSSFGLFGGIIFFIASLVSMGVYAMFEQQNRCNSSYLVFGIVDISLFSVALIACFVGFWQMRKLQYRLHAHGEFIDEILLIIGLTGELIYCTIGIDIFIENIRTSETERSLLPVFVFVVRLLQVASQTAFILLTSRLRCLSAYAIKYLPGKQIITFLLICNLALFGFHTFESMKHSYGISDNANVVYLQIAYAVMPLLVFFRFHSSACLAEIWKHTYSTKEAHHSSASSVLSHPTNNNHQRTDSRLTIESVPTNMDERSICDSQSRIVV